jgi:hypothetical protein
MFSTKYCHTEFNNMSKRSYTMTKSVSFQGCKDASTYINPAPSHDKSSEKTRNRRNIPQHNKGYV